MYKKTIELLATILVVIGIIFILIGVGKSEAYILQTKQVCLKNIWGYCWGERAVEIYDKLKQLGFTSYQSALIINKCKKFEKLGMKGGVNNCIIAVAGIATAESGGFKHCYQGQCMGVKKFGFVNLSDNLDDWLSRYSKYWYTWRLKGGASFFYSLNGRPSSSRYCTEEQSSGMKRFHCPNGREHFNYVFYYLTK